MISIFSDKGFEKQSMHRINAKESLAYDHSTWEELFVSVMKVLLAHSKIPVIQLRCFSDTSMHMLHNLYL